MQNMLSGLLTSLMGKIATAMRTRTKKTLC